MEEISSGGGREPVLRSLDKRAREAEKYLYNLERRQGKMIKYVSVIIAAVFNIVAIIVKATGHETVTEVLYAVMPYVDTLAIAVMWALGFKERYRITGMVEKK
jgi:uncharacterized membrane protein YkvI